MKRISIIFSLFLALLLTPALISCKKDPSGAPKNLSIITKSAIFTQNEESYYVYFYRRGCTACEVAAETVSTYASAASKSAIKPIYGVRLYRSLDEDGAIAPLIYRSYEGDDGEGKAGNYKVTGATSWKDLYIGSTPALIMISMIDGVMSASYVAQGSTDIISRLSL